MYEEFLLSPDEFNALPLSYVVLSPLPPEQIPTFDEMLAAIERAKAGMEPFDSGAFDAPCLLIRENREAGNKHNSPPELTDHLDRSRQVCRFIPVEKRTKDPTPG